MTEDRQLQPSFQIGQRWKIGVRVLISILSVASILVMVNFLASRHSRIWDLSPTTEAHLTPMTLRLLDAVTNEVSVIVFYDWRSDTYSSVSRLIDQMDQRCPWLEVEYVDYIRFRERAEAIRAKYDLVSEDIGDRVIFHGNGNTRIVYERELSEFDYSRALSERKIKRVAFKGEQLFASALYGIIDPKRVTVYFLQGHGEHDPSDTDDQRGYSKFGAALEESGIRTESLSLMPNTIPSDCELLVVANPSSALLADEVQEIETYLDQGGRLLALFGNSTVQRESGMEKMLEKWGVRIGRNYVIDRAQSKSNDPRFLIVDQFGDHPIVKPLHESRLHMIVPRSVEIVSSADENADGMQVSPLGYTSSRGVTVISARSIGREGTIPVAVAIEKRAKKPDGSPQTPSRIVAIGESLFLANFGIELLENRDFGRLAVNWLLDRDLLLSGIGPRAIKEFTVTLTESEMTKIRWLFVGVIPGGFFLIGCVVWYRRRM